ncbi:hypothetical protein E2P81_ATG07981 [Venturia nashicola]|uniref:DNA replication factor Cdt1 C-terminal domain-containing protein n=1 Tax=Venturia nashicola TaxID=86259 RepID=A0A4Z1P616_9PEZI|nr:hypothetical protein E6O75_ATG08155 [Venturia nashicola]TLD26169.1 hypothetical protein E2P81_ATG07981 [Venturia nashicola]
MARSQTYIHAFAKVSKPLGDGQATSNKRKHTRDIRDSSPEPAVNRKKQRLQLLTPPETPTKALKHAIANLSLSAIPLPALKVTKRKRAATLDIETPPTSPDPEDFEGIHHATDVPLEIEDLMNLNSAFLTALALQYAHHGSASPVDIRTLTPSVTKAWGKRKATVEDITLCLGVTASKNTKRNAFVLSNYGNGRVCVELGGKKQRKGFMYQGFNETEMRQQFELNLERAWKKWSAKGDTKAFIQDLPRAEIRKCSSLVKLEPTLAKGQQRLDQVLGPKESRHLKRRKVTFAEEPATVKKEEDVSVPAAEPVEVESATQKPATSATRGLDLLTRIQQKQHALSLLPTGPSQDQQNHTRALQRVEEILTILDLLAAGKGTGSRVSFPLPPLIQSIQASLRSPMEKEEVQRVLDIMVEEVAKGFVKIVGFGGVRACVVNRILRPRPEVLRERIEQAGKY